MGKALELIDMQMHQPAGWISRETATAARAEQRRGGRGGVGGGRCTLNQARQVLGELGECVMLQPPYKGTLSHVVATKLEHIA